MSDSQVSNFCDFTGADVQVAHRVLEMAGGNLEAAIQLYFESPELQRGLAGQTAGETTATSTSTANQSSSATSRQQPASASLGRQDASGVIHIDSDDDDEEIQSFSDDEGDNEDIAGVVRTAQEEEDAAMAKRMQEELYREGAPAEDSVRSPIARRTETLVDMDPFGPGHDQIAYEQFVRQQRQQRHRPGAANPFEQSIWTDTRGTDLGSSSTSATNSRAPAPTARAQRLAELFRPPLDLMSHLAWDDARSEGKEDKKWILVNLQDMADFNCQALNRDIWKDEAVHELVKDNFIFLQYATDDPRAEQYINFYFPHRSHEDPDNYPHVSIVDPRTGEQVKIWSGKPFPSASNFHSQLAAFLDQYSLSANSKNPVATVPAQQRKPTLDVDRMTEDEMLEMALRESLGGGGGNGGEATSSSGAQTSGVESFGIGSPRQATPGLPNTAAAPEPSSSSPFAQISSTQPHTEPGNDPATTTRIQFRHANGRVIRRFAVQDPIRRIYEWLKAEPLEGQEGVEFELKRMPQGQDLIESLDETIEGAGLKQGTIMIEFITE